MLRKASPEYIPKHVANTAIAAFTELAKAEARTHNAPSAADVHFHEVGAIDSIVDTVGTLLALWFLQVDTVSCSRLPLGEGTVWTDHGLLPVPAPAAMRLLVGLPTCAGPPGNTGELVTPTAAAVLRVLTINGPKTKTPGRPPSFVPRRIGLGAGTKDFVKHPNVVRLIIGDQVVEENARMPGNDLVQQPLDINPPTTRHHTNPANTNQINAPEKNMEPPGVAISETKDVVPEQKWKMDRLVQLEANLDDTTAEVLAFTVDELLKNGAIDAWVHPIVMKKGRAAHTLHCLCHDGGDSDELVNKLMEVIFRQSTTLGIRIYRNIERAALRRQFASVRTPFVDPKHDGCVDVKISYLGDEVASVKAEFDQCKDISMHTQVPLKRIAEFATRKVLEDMEQRVEAEKIKPT